MPILMRDDSGEPRASFEGCVLYTGELNGYDDSDFYAIVWDAAAGRTRQIEYASTRYWSYDSGASVDATPDVVAAASEYVRAYALSIPPASSPHHESACLSPACPSRADIHKPHRRQRIGWPE